MADFSGNNKLTKNLKNKLKYELKWRNMKQNSLRANALPAAI